MRVKIPFIFVCLLAVVFVSGCETLGSRQRREANMRRSSDVANMKASIDRLERQVEDMQSGNEAIFRELENMGRLLANESRKTDERLAAIDLKLNSEAVAREKMRKSIISELSTKVSTIISTRTAPVRSFGSGWEHIVKSGQTLSEIAAEYKVKVKVIVRENNLKNPDDIKVGQKLFIPE